MWMNLKNIMLNERSHALKTAYYIIPFIGHSGTGENIQREIRSMVTNTEDFITKGHNVTFRGDRNALSQLWWRLHDYTHDTLLNRMFTIGKLYFM